jgi:hypothetical protein
MHTAWQIGKACKHLWQDMNRPEDQMCNRLTGIIRRADGSALGRGVKWGAILIFAAAITVCNGASAVDLDRLGNEETFRNLDAAPPRPGIEWLVSLGAAHVAAESGDDIFVTPFQIVKKLSSRTSIKMEGDGYQHVGSGFGNAHGFSNVTLGLSQTVYKDDNSRFRLTPGVTIPGGREVGSGSSKLRLSASYIRFLNERWDWLVEARLARIKRQPVTGKSRIEQGALMQVGYTFSDSPKSDIVSHDMLFHISRQYRGGAGGSTEAGVTYELPLTKDIELSLVFTRGITSGARDKTAEFYVTFGF